MNYTNYKNLELVRFRREISFCLHLEKSDCDKTVRKTVIPGMGEQSVEMTNDSSIQKIQ